MAVFALTAGCSASPSDAPWRERIEFAQTHATSDFERAALEDGMISDGEFIEGFERFSRCMGDHGYDVQRTTYKGEHAGFSVPQTDVSDNVVLGCQAGTTVLIEPLYTGMRSDPDNGDNWTLFLTCAKQKGLVAEEYSREDLIRDSDTASGGVLPFDMVSESALDCFYGV